MVVIFLVYLPFFLKKGQTIPYIRLWKAFA